MSDVPGAIVGASYFRLIGRRPCLDLEAGSKVLVLNTPAAPQFRLGLDAKASLRDIG